MNTNLNQNRLGRSEKGALPLMTVAEPNRKKKNFFLPGKSSRNERRLSQVRQQKATILQTLNFSSGLCLLQLSNFLFPSLKEYSPCCGRMCMGFAMSVDPKLQFFADSE